MKFVTGCACFVLGVLVSLTAPMVAQTQHQTLQASNRALTFTGSAEKWSAEWVPRLWHSVTASVVEVSADYRKVKVGSMVNLVTLSPEATWLLVCVGHQAQVNDMDKECYQLSGGKLEPYKSAVLTFGE